MNTIIQLLISLAAFIGTYLIAYLIRYVGDLGAAVIFVGTWLCFASALFVIKKSHRRLALIYLDDKSVWNQRLSGGSWMYTLRLIIALPMAILFLMPLAFGLSKQQWLLVAVTLSVWPISFLCFQYWSKKHVKAEAQTHLSAKLSQLFMLTVSVVLFASYSFFYAELPNLSALSLAEAYEYGMKSAAVDIAANSDVLAVTLAYLSAGNHLFLWLIEQVSQKLDVAAKIALWILYAIKSAFVIGPLFWLLRSLSLLGEENKSVRQRLVRASAGLPIVFFVGLFVSSFMVFPSVKHLWEEVRCIALDSDDVCYVVTSNELEIAISAAAKKLTPTQKKAAQKIVEESERRIGALFGQAHTEVDSYLEWHYSVLGKAALAFSITAEKAIDEKLFSGQGVKESYDAIARKIAIKLEVENQRFINEFKNEVQQSLSNYPQRKQENPITINLEKNLVQFQQIYRREQAKALVQLGAAATGAGGVLLAARSVAKQAAKQAGKQVGKRAASAEVASACLITGPYVFACSVAVFVASTVAIEYAEIKLDEAFNKESLKIEIESWLTNTEKELKQALKIRVVNAFPDSYQELSKQVAAQGFSTMYEKL